MPFINLKSLPIKGPVPGFEGVFVHTTTMTLAYWKVQERSHCSRPVRCG